MWVCGAAGGPGVAVVADDDGFGGVGAVDDADDVPGGGEEVGLVVDEGHGEGGGGGADVVGDVVVGEAARVPGGGERGGGRAVVVEGAEEGERVGVGDWERGDGGDFAVDGLPRDAGLGRVAGGGWVAGSDAWHGVSRGCVHGGADALRNWTLPRCTLEGLRAGPCGYAR